LRGGAYSGMGVSVWLHLGLLLAGGSWTLHWLSGAALFLREGLLLLSCSSWRDAGFLWPSICGVAPCELKRLFSHCLALCGTCVSEFAPSFLRLAHGTHVSPSGPVLVQPPIKP